jgi:hypothetical protein
VYQNVKTVLLRSLRIKALSLRVKALSLRGAWCEDVDKWAASPLVKRASPWLRPQRVFGVNITIVRYLKN